ncbi:ROK family protein [Paenibacillus frigoriresistens]|uniref:ROK family protein n=1 Tax=Paenibacillus alginolyticus TaxID=59839 RepID=UPI0015660BE3|nr:ROK family protein [Paenibacillus frigoriresistens]NRF93786.1 ROK family protein [Paenibacillus frigoriresistens]
MLLGAIEGGGTKFVCGIGTPEGEIVERISIPTTTPEETLDRAIIFFEKQSIEAIGIGTFGPIDLNAQSANYGSVTSTPKPNWSGYRIVEHLKRRFNGPIGFDTDVNAAALGELTWGAAKGLNSCLYMTIGTGIGAGAIVEGKLLHGLTHPEMGHIVVRRHLNDSYDGHCPFHRDCLEGLAAGPAIEARWDRKAEQLESTHLAWEIESYYIAQALVNYTLILSPEKIILGGGVMKQSQLFPLIREQFLNIMNGYVNNNVISKDINDYIVQPGLGSNAGLCGALALAKQILAS